jgi:hypothetical protein
VFLTAKRIRLFPDRPSFENMAATLAALRAERERTKRRKFIRERCFNRFRVLEIDQLRGLPRAHCSTHDSGVYFLWDGPRLVYIGKANCVHDRLAAHRRNRVWFTHATYEALHQSCALWCESQYIRRYRPPLNMQGKA